MTIVPPYLESGDTIGIICPSGYMPAEKTVECVKALERWGFKVKTGLTVGNQFNYFSGTDDERLYDLQTMLDDQDVKAILCGRGGYGLSRIIDNINFKKFRQFPKWVIGYSDITLLLSHLFSRYRIAGIHSPMAAAFNDNGYKSAYIHALKTTLTGKKGNYECAANAANQAGMASGKLVGGNLAMLCHTIGTSSEVSTTGNILFIEEVGEYIYSVDRMLQQLRRSSKLSGLAGLIVGSFTDMKDTIIPFGRTVTDLISELVKLYKYPVCFGFPVGHSPENYPLKTGIEYTLKVTDKKVVLTEN